MSKIYDHYPSPDVHSARDHSTNQSRRQHYLPQIPPNRNTKSQLQDNFLASKPLPCYKKGSDTYIKPPSRHLLRFIPIRRRGPRQLNLFLFLAFGFWLFAYLYATSAIAGLVGEGVGFWIWGGFGGGGAHVCGKRGVSMDG